VQPDDEQQPPFDKEHEVVAEWLGIDSGSLTPLEPAVILQIQRRRHQLDAALKTVAELRAGLRTDPLTGSLNRRGVDEQFAMEITRARRKNEPLAVIVLDVVDLKRTNDDFGHGAGDDLLRATSVAIRSQLRPTDHLGRTGGDEFMILLPCTTGDQSARVSDRVVKAVRKIQLEAAPARRVDISPGWASTSEDGLRYATLTQVADDRLYERRGRPSRSAARSAKLYRARAQECEHGISGRCDWCQPH
jgi:diguanylate cyclase